MKVLFAGYGSIARRHINNLREICLERQDPLLIDLLRKTSRETPEGVRNVYSNACSIKEKYDAVFITNPTSVHYATLVDLFDKSNAFFVEKPVFDSVDLDIGVFEDPRKIIHVACPLRFTKTIEWLSENVPRASILGVRCISSSYLPDWRPGVDYRDTYSAKKDMGGGVHIDLIHELDYVCSLLGTPASVKSMMGKKSNLEIDSYDFALYIADFGTATAEIHVDYYGRAPVRRVEVFTREDTLVCDLLRSTIEFLKSGTKLDFNEQRDDFQKKELEYFLSCIAQGKKSENDIVEAVQVLSIAKGREF